MHEEWFRFNLVAGRFDHLVPVGVADKEAYLRQRFQRS